MRTIDENNEGEMVYLVYFSGDSGFLYSWFYVRSIELSSEAAARLASANDSTVRPPGVISGQTGGISL